MFDENIETIRGLIEKLRNEPREQTPEKDRLRVAWDNLAGHTLVFVDTAEQFGALKAVVRHGNRALKEQMNTRALQMDLEVPFEL